MPIEYTTSKGEKVFIPESIDPLSVLDIPPKSSRDGNFSKLALKRNLTANSKQQERAKASLAYHMLTSPSKYLQKGNKYDIKMPTFLYWQQWAIKRELLLRLPEMPVS